MSPAAAASPTTLVAAFVRRPGRRLALVLVAGVCVALALALQTVAYLTAQPLPVLLHVLHVLAVAVGFGGIGVVAVHALGRTSEPSPRTLWTLVLVVAAAGLLGFGLDWWLVPSGLVDEERSGFGFLKNGAPGALRTVALMATAAAVKLVVALLVLVRLRDFVLWRRTPLSARLWRYMVGGFVLYAVAREVFAGPLATPLGGYVNTAMQVVLGLLMGANAARLSWIVYLSFREKMLTLLTTLCLFVVMLLALGFEESLLLTTEAGVLRHFSPGLDRFTSAALVFGLVYSLGAFLLLLFHLPTSTDFERRNGERLAFADFSRLIGQAFNAQQLADAIVEASVKGGAADRAWLVLLDEASLAPVVVAAQNVPLDDAAKVVDAAAFLATLGPERLPIQLDEALADLRVRHRIGVPVGSLVAVPLVAREDVLGILFAARTEPFGFASDDRRTLQSVAAQASLALDHARLFESRVEQERLQRELDIARSVQQRLLPQRLPDVPCTGLHASSVPALEVGGDYYDALVLDDGRLGLIVADVSGKGTSAAFYMAELKGVFRALAQEQTSPAAFLRRAHRALALAPGTFVSALYALFDPKTGALTLARAGHCPAVLVPHDGSAPTLVKASGLGLGLDHGGTFDRVLRDVSLTLAPGDALVLYTDGVVESRNPEGEEYGYDRLLEAAFCHRCHDAERLHAAVLDDLHGFLRGEAYADDMTLMALVWTGPPDDAPDDDAFPAYGPV